MNTRHCAVCGWASRDGQELPGWCERCRARTTADVADLPEFYRALGEVMTPGAAGEQQRVAGSKTAPLPFRLDPANLRGPVTAGELPGPDNGGGLSIATVLAATRLAIREACDLTDMRIGVGRHSTQSMVEADAAFVIGFLPRYAELAENDALAGAVEIIHDTRQRAWHTLGYGAHKVYLGPCPYVDPRDRTGAAACGRELWIDPVMADSVTCRDCGTRWDRRYFLWLRRIAQEEESG